MFDQTMSEIEPSPFGPNLPPQRPETVFPWSSLIWGSTLITALLLLMFFLPAAIEEVGFSLNRGPERAKAEAAREALNGLEMKDLSSGFQLVPQAVIPSVVHIRINKNERPFNGDGGRHPFSRSPKKEYKSKGQGSGVIVDSEGFIVTNNHVVEGAQQINVQLSDGRILPGRLIGHDALSDLAVLKIEAKNLTSAPWGDSDRLDVGSFVWAIGSPFGLHHSVTFGIISAKNRDEFIGNRLQNFLQTDAAVNPGNSGGPLVNMRGEIIGINTAIVGESYQGISLAIPSNVVREVYDRIRSGGSLHADGALRRGYLGVRLDPVSATDAKRLRLESTAGARVGSVQPGSPAARADPPLEVDDVIVSWEGEIIANTNSLFQIIGSSEVGSKITAELIRDGRKIDVKIEVGLRPHRVF